jgi:hypothetical protein
MKTPPLSLLQALVVMALAPLPATMRPRFARGIPDRVLRPPEASAARIAAAHEKRMRRQARNLDNAARGAFGEHWQAAL